jgi:hypothetical protein
LSATPEKEDKTRREILSVGGDSPSLALPDVSDYQYYISLWREAGTLGTGATGISRLSWTEIKSWQDIRESGGCIPLSLFESNLVRELSESYASQYSISSAKDCPPPYIPVVQDIDPVALTARFKNILGMLQPPKKN